MTASLRVLPAPSGVRDDAERVSLVITEALAPCLEGIAACDEAIAGFDRVVLAAIADASMAVVHEAQRTAARLIACRDELRRMAGVVEPRPDDSMAVAA